MTHGHAVFQCHRTGRLYDRTVGQGVAEGDAHLHEIDAVTLHGFDDVAGTLKRGQPAQKYRLSNLRSPRLEKTWLILFIFDLLYKLS